MQAVRALDARPIILNALNHSDRNLDSESRPRRGPFGLRRLVAEKAILGLLGPSDILGLDAYTAIGAEDRGTQVLRSAAPDWAESAASQLRAARRRGQEAWIIEAQAEPWESTHATYADPLSFAPEDMGAVYDRLVGAGYSTILLWGCEYWLLRGPGRGVCGGCAARRGWI